MSRIVYAAPELTALHLLQRLQRELQQHGHSVHLLTVDPAAGLWFAAQGLDTTTLRPANSSSATIPDDFAERDARLAGRRRSARWLRRRSRFYNGCWQAALSWLASQQPDLLLFCGRRDGEAACLQFAARQLGVPLLWLGAGLLPHTLQWDPHGIDGDAAQSPAALTYRAVDRDPAWLASCLAQVLGGNEPAALSRAPLQRPDPHQQQRLLLQQLRTGGLAAATRVASILRQSAIPPPLPNLAPAALPTPHCCVLLQDENDPRRLLDAGSPPGHALLLEAALAAATALDPTLQLAVVLPPGGLQLRQRHRWPQSRLRWLPSTAAAATAATAAATFTINHPAATAALLAGTPVLHCGRARYALPGVSYATTPAGFAKLLPIAIADPQPLLRERFLCWLLRERHLWCSFQAPDHNGMLGLTATVLQAAGASLPAVTRGYRAGPCWPLNS